MFSYYASSFFLFLYFLYSRSSFIFQKKPDILDMKECAGVGAGVGLAQAPKNVRLFSYNELKSATRNFHSTNKIGRGGFGVVYKVRLWSSVVVDYFIILFIILLLVWVVKQPFHSFAMMVCFILNKLISV